MPALSNPEYNEDLTAEAVVPAAICSASEEVRRMVFAFDDHARQQEVRRVAARVKALEDALGAGSSPSPWFELLADLRREAKSYMEKGNQGSSNADYYCGKSWAYDDAADRLESTLKANTDSANQRLAEQPASTP